MEDAGTTTIDHEFDLMFEQSMNPKILAMMAQNLGPAGDPESKE